MFDLIWDIATIVGPAYAGVWGTRKYYRVGREAPAAVAAREQAKARKALTR